MERKNMQPEQYVSKGVTENVDNLVLQRILILTEKVKLHKDELVVFKLGKCPHCNKQYISLEEQEEREAEEECIFCEKPTDNRVIVYQMGTNKQVICLEYEAEGLVKEEK